MPHKTGLSLLLLFLIVAGSGCTSAQQQRKLNTAYQQVNILKVNATKICEISNQCHYVKDVRCYSRLTPKHIRKCEQGIREHTIDSGGDTFVYLLNKDSQRNKTHISYGQVYDCTGTNREFNVHTATKSNKYNARLFHPDTIKQCGLPASCRPLPNSWCISKLGNLTARCAEIVNIETLRYPGNAFFADENYIYSKQNGYNLEARAYVCDP